MADTRLSDRAVLRLSATEKGEDVKEFLQGLVTNDVRTLSDGKPLWAALLSAQGKALFDFIVWQEGDDILLDCEAECADELAKRLSLYRLRRKIAIARDEALAVHWAKDANAAGKPADPRLAALGQRWVSKGRDGSGIGSGDASAAWHAHRLSLGVPEGRAELGHDKTLWLECNAIELNGVAFDKGCYVGQENTARMNWRNKVNRRLVVVPLANADEKRQRIAYRDLALSVEHRRIEDMSGLDLPQWQAAAIATPLAENES